MKIFSEPDTSVIHCCPKSFTLEHSLPTMQSCTFARNRADSVGEAEVCVYHWEYCSVLHRIIDTFYGSYGFEVKEDFLLRSIQRYTSLFFACL